MQSIGIRGMGLVSCYGRGVAAAVAGMRAGRHGMTPLTRFPLPFQDQLRVNQFDPELVPPGASGAGTSMAAAVREALTEAGLDHTALRDAALIVGTNSFLFISEGDYWQQFSATGATDIPYLPPAGAVAQQFAARLGIEGPVLTLSTACSSSANALLVAADMLRRGTARRALVIGIEGLSAIALSGFHSLQLLDPEGCRPFDPARRGMQIGEAVGAVLLETGASPGTTRLLGGANLCDTHHMTSATPDGSAMREVMQRALDATGLDSTDIEVIKAHGTGSLDNDAAEAAAMRSLFGDPLPPFTAIKRYLGHTLGACGTVELAAFLGCLRAGFVPPTAGWSQPDPALHVTPVNGRMTAPPGVAMLNYFGFGGNYASLLIDRDRS